MARAQSLRTHCPNGHPYSDENTYITRNGGRACKACKKAWALAHSEQAKDYRAANAAKARKRANEWYYANHERAKETRLAYLAENRERKRASDREYRAANPERMRERVKQWRKAHPLKKVAQNHSRKARKCNAAGSFTVEQWQARLAYHGWQCRYCGSTDELTIDHMIPVVRGGSNWPSNLVPACNSCNSKKHSSNYREFLTRIASDPQWPKHTSPSLLASASQTQTTDR